jgi:hypothetical protein
MPHWDAAIEYVVVPPPLALAVDVAGLHKLRDDSLSRSLRNPHRLGDIAQAHARVALQAEEHLSVTREEMPAA